MTTPNMEDLIGTLVKRHYDIVPGTLEVRSAEDADTPRGRIRGLAVPYNVTTERAGYYPERIAPGAVINRNVSADTPLPLRFEHEHTMGVIDSLTNTERGCEISAQILDTAIGRDAITLIEGKAIRSFSIGFFPRHGVQDTETREITWDEIELFEVSAVTVPAYQTAEIEEIRSAALAAATTAEAAVEAAHIILTPTPEVRAADDTNDSAPAEEENDTMTDSTEVLEQLRATNAEALKANSNIEDLRSALTLNNDKLDELVRSFVPVPAEDLTPDTRSIGALQRAMFNGDTEAVAVVQDGQTRAFADESGVVADVAQLPTYLQRAIKIETANSPIANEFSQSPLPANTTHIAYKVLKSNTITAAKQENEGDDLVKGKLTFENKYTEVETIGGWSEASFQEILLGGGPTGVNIVNTIYDALAKALGQTVNNRVRTALINTYTENTNVSTTNGHTPKVAGTDFLDLGATSGFTAAKVVGAIVDAAGIFSDRGNTLKGLIVPRALFKAFATMTAEDGRTIFNIYGDGTNNIGEFSPRALGGNVAGLKVVLDPSSDFTGKAVFYGEDAIRRYESQGYTLQAQTIVNLAKQFSAFKFLAVAVENAGAVVPAKFS